jgi:CheY-like chemotaxis protein
MVFALGGGDALAALESTAFDVVVTDMRMPGLDGVQLLTETIRLSPSTVRIVLSGQTDRSQAVRAAGVAHQFIVKPSSSETVQAVIDRVCQQRDLLPEAPLRAAAGALRAVPVPALRLEALREALRAAETNHAVLARIVEADPGLLAKLLQLVNSAFFGAPRDVADVETALRLLGPALLRELLDSGEVFAPSGDADAAAPISLEAAPSTVDVLRAFGPTVMGAAAGGSPDVAARLGAYVLGLWNLPDALVDAVSPSAAAPTDSAPR